MRSRCELAGTAAVIIWLGLAVDRLEVDAPTPARDSAGSTLSAPGASPKGLGSPAR